MDVYPETWTWRERYLTSGRLPGPPHHGLGRPMKVGKEEVAGLVVALRRFVARDHAAERAAQQRQLEMILAAVADLPGVRTELHAERPTPLGIVRLDEAVIGQSAASIVNALIEGKPAIAVSQNVLHENALGLIASVLQPGEEAIVAERLHAVLAARGT